MACANCRIVPLLGCQPFIQLRRLHSLYVTHACLCEYMMPLTISSNPPPGADKRDSSPTIGKPPWIFFATRLMLAIISLHRHMHNMSQALVCACNSRTRGQTGHDHSLATALRCAHDQLPGSAATAAAATPRHCCCSTLPARIC